MEGVNSKNSNPFHLNDTEEIHLSEIFDSKTEEILSELNMNVEALDSSNFSVVDYINEMFPNEQSLSNLDDIMEGIEIRIKELDDESRKTLRGQWKTEAAGQEAVQESTSMIQDLFSRIREVQDRATHSENMVKEITRDIQQLDLAKRNLTTSITTLNNLTLIMSSVDKLKQVLNLSESNQSEEKSTNPFESSNKPTDTSLTINYSEIDEHLGHSIKILNHLLAQFPDVPVVKDLDLDMQQIKKELSQGQLQNDIRHVLMSGKANSSNPNLIQQLHAMCRVIDQLAPEVRRQLTKWFIDQQLSEYRVLFEETQTTAWLDKIDHRYSWLRSSLINFDKRFNLYFPKTWLMTERLILEFCNYTKSALTSLMRQRNSELNDNLIIFAITRTQVFEDVLKKLFCSETLIQLIDSINSTNPFEENTTRSSVQSTTIKPAKPKESISKVDNDDDEEATDAANPINGLISSCFEPYLHLYIEEVDRVLTDQMNNNLINDVSVNESSINDKEFEEVLGQFKQDEANLASSQGQDEDSAENSFNSATSLFLLYRKVLNQAPQLSRGIALVELSKVLAKHLREYNYRVLHAQMPQQRKSTVVSQLANATTNLTSGTSAAIGSSNSCSVVDTTASTVVSSGATAANQLFQSLLKDDQSIRLSKDEVKKVSVILVTACYCLKTVEALEKRLKSKVRPNAELAPQIDMSSEIELFRQTRSSAVQLLATDLECSCEPALLAMQKLNWAGVIAVGDQSHYVSSIQSRLVETVPMVRRYLNTVRAFFTQFCIQFVNGFVQRFIAALFKCRGLGAVGSVAAAEQLLLDTHSLKTVLMKLPVLGSKISRDPPRSFTNVVLQRMGHAEKIIKAVMAPHSRPKDFLDSLLHLLPECDSLELQKILEMKGLKRSEQVSILELFKKHSTTAVMMISTNTTAVDKTLLTNQNSDELLLGQSNTVGGSAINKINQLEKFIKIIK